MAWLQWALFQEAHLGRLISLHCGGSCSWGHTLSLCSLPARAGPGRCECLSERAPPAGRGVGVAATSCFQDVVTEQAPLAVANPFMNHSFCCHEGQERLRCRGKPLFLHIFKKKNKTRHCVFKSLSQALMGHCSLLDCVPLWGKKTK